MSPARPVLGPRGHCDECGRDHALPPSPEAMAAARELMSVLARSAGPRREGKMFGVLVGIDPEGTAVRLRAFSGALDGRLQTDGFVGPTGPVRATADEERRTLEALTSLSARIEAIDVRGAEDALRRARHELDTEIEACVEARRLAKTRRAAERAGPLAPGESAEARESRLEAISQREGGQLRALRRRRREILAPLERAWTERAAHRARLRSERRVLSRSLQATLHAAHGLFNFAGRHRLLEDLFDGGIPTGAGECCAPKLLQEAALRGIRPTGLVEFWWGPPSPDGARTHGRFYSPCDEKCVPLLGHLLCGGDAPRPPLAVLYEDADLLAVDKPAGLLSVPGRTRAGSDCVEVRLARLRPDLPFLRAVHRLDEATSGVLLLAKSRETLGALTRAFARREVRKEYRARVAGRVRAERGEIRLSLRGDPADRPRQVVDHARGRSASTTFHVLERHAGTTDLALHPSTGRTHQLRVHCAHQGGLGCPIVGDALYGSEADATRLLLHAFRLELVHPRTGGPIELCAPLPAELRAGSGA